MYSDFSKYLIFEDKKEKVEVGNTYLVSLDGKHPVGLLHLHSLVDKEVRLHYGIHPDFRRRGYGTLLLEEVSTYLLGKDFEIQTITLEINPENIGSIKCASNACFLEHEDKKGIKIYQKRK